MWVNNIVTQIMKRIRLASLTAIVIFAQALHAETFELGGRKVEIPAPSGFVRVTDDMGEVKRFVDQFVDPLNDTLAFYIPESAVPKALGGEIPEFERYFMLKVNKKLKAYTVSVAEFSELRATVASQNEKIIEEVKSSLPNYMDQINKNITKEYDMNLGLSVSQMIPLAPHQDSSNAFAYSMFMSVGIQGENGEIKSVIPATVTFLNTSGRIIFLYSYGAKDDLEWTRISSESWHTAILTQNTPPPQSKPKVGMDWEQVGGKALIGAIIGGLVALIGGVILKKKKNEG